MGFMTMSIHKAARTSSLHLCIFMIYIQIVHIVVTCRHVRTYERMYVAHVVLLFKYRCTASQCTAVLQVTLATQGHLRGWTLTSTGWSWGQ